MKKVYTVNSKLESNGISTERVIESLDDCEDDMIEVNDRVHVQVGDGYLTVCTKLSEENYLMTHATNKDIVEKVQFALGYKVIP